ncbi:MAG: matrixin family metalloprotease, partial [Myxococcales bacterium]|nr:matrixin family metalloprotease [Myxococcales bacterium]
MSARRILPLLAACACAVVLGASNSASAYVQQRSSTTGVPLKWTKLPVRFNINTRAAKGVTNAQIAAAVRAAYAAWTAPSCTNVTVQDTGSTQSDGNRQDSVNTNSWLTGWPAEYGSSTLGLTLTIYNPQSGSINDADTVYNPNYTWSTSGSQFAIDVQSVATHEIGHQLGLDHTPITSATMFRSTGQGDTSQRSLHSDDIQGICGIYPSGQGGTTPECTTKAQCAPNEDCVSGKCVTTGTKGYGGPCDAADACNSGICLRSNGVQVCTQLCEQQACPNGDQCVSVSSSTGQTTKACLPGTAQTGTKDLGDACTSNNDCKTEICVSVPGSGYL